MQPSAPQAHPARYAVLREDGRFQCGLCPHHCVLAEGQVGRCGARGVRDGQMRALTYGVYSSLALDPIEKKPLYHFYPGCNIVSIGGWGCNLSCAYCQNHGISQRVVDGRSIAPAEVLQLAKREASSVGVAFTYNEPVIWYEFVMDCARLLKEAGLAVVLVTNGYIEAEPLEELLPWVDAANVDLKSLDEGFYQQLCGGRLGPVLDSIARFSRRCHLEVTKLLVTGHVDPVLDAENVARWIAREVSPDVPLHLSRYFPQHRWRSPETSTEMLRESYRAAGAHLRYVYVGNARLEGASDTHCPECGRVVIRRTGFEAQVVGLTSEGACATCGNAVPVRGLGR